MRSSDPVRGSVAAWVPRWWKGEGGRAGRALHAALGPAEAVYRGVTVARNRLYDRGWLAAAEPPIPVVSIGNIGVGGAGKTPVAAWVAGRLRDLGARPAVVLRGYGRDEVLVHRELNPEVPVFADAVRVRAVAAAAGEGCTVAVLDDAFQHRRIARTLDVVLLPVEAWAGNRRLLPRGPWREGLRSLERADLVLVTRKSATSDQSDRVRREVEAAAPGLPIAGCLLDPDCLTPLHGRPGDPCESLAGRRVLAVAALAAPEPFVENLRHRFGADVELAAFRDHHEFTADEASRLQRAAADRPLVMTLKDAVKLRGLLDPAVPALVLRQRVRIEWGADRLDRAIRDVATEAE